MNKERVKKLKRVNNLVKELGEAYFHEIHAKTGFSKPNIRNLLDDLVEMGCLSKRRMVGEGYVCRYKYLMDVPFNEPVELDFTEHYQVFRNMITYGQMQRGV